MALKRQSFPFWEPFQVQILHYGVGQADAQRQDEYSTPVKTGCQGIVTSQCREDSCYCVEFQSPEDCPSRLRPFGIQRTARPAITGDVSVWQYSRSGPFAQIGVNLSRRPRELISCRSIRAWVPSLGYGLGTLLVHSLKSS